MSEIFVSYARATATEAQAVAEALRALGYGVWRDDELPAHRLYAEVIEERLATAKAVVVIWSAAAVKSQWVRAEADVAREAGILVQLSVDGSIPPLPFNQIQCADMAGWTGDPDAPGWRKVLGSLGELMGQSRAPAAPAAPPTLTVPTKASIAVMPFANLSGDAEQEYFADGMVEEITTALSRIRSIFVIASGSTLSLKGKALSAKEIGRILGVRYVLEGSVRKSSNRVRIAVKLIDAAHGAQVWAERFEGTLEDVFTLQDTVALSVAGVIEPALQRAEIERASVRPMRDATSYDLCLRAIPLIRVNGRAETLEAVDLLDQALAADPDDGPTLGWAACAHVLVARFGWSDDPAGHHSRAAELAQRALQVGGDDATVLSNVSNVLLMLGHAPDVAKPLIERSVELNPGSAMAWMFSARVQLALGEPELAFEHVQTSMRLDPLSPDRSFQLTNMGLARLAQGRFGEAAALFSESSQIRATVAFNHACIAACCGHLGQTKAASQALERFRSGSREPIADLAARLFHRPQHRQLFLDGIALAEGRDAE
jgi:adenylate cyclase